MWERQWSSSISAQWKEDWKLNWVSTVTSDNSARLAVKMGTSAGARRWASGFMVPGRKGEVLKETTSSYLPCRKTFKHLCWRANAICPSPGEIRSSRPAEVPTKGKDVRQIRTGTYLWEEGQREWKWTCCRISSCWHHELDDVTWPPHVMAAERERALRGYRFAWICLKHLASLSRHLRGEEATPIIVR